MTRVADRIYTASDLNGRARREFIEDAQRDSARLRTTSGESLVMLREAKLDHVSAIRDYALAYLMLDAALSRPRAERRPAEFGDWAFIEVFDDDDIAEFQTEVNDAIIRAASGHDHHAVDELLDAWRRSARTLSDPVAREILEDNVADADWVPVEGE
jgi:hypothetical protein